MATPQFWNIYKLRGRQYECYAVLKYLIMEIIYKFAVLFQIAEFYFQL
jgi:hypothetical protein